MKSEIDWNTLAELFKQEGLAERENLVYTILLSGSSISKGHHNALSIYNHDYSKINTIDEWKKLVYTVKENIPSSGWGFYHSLKQYLLNFVKRKDFIYEITLELVKNSNSYLEYFHLHDFNNIVSDYLSFKKIKSDIDIKILEFGAISNFLKPIHYSNIDLSIKQDVLMNLAKHKDVKNQLSCIIPELEISSIDEWNEIFKDKLEYESMNLASAYKFSFYQDIVDNCFKDILSLDVITKAKSQNAWFILINYISFALSQKHSISPTVYDVLRKVHKLGNINKNELVLRNLYENEKIKDTKEFEEYIKYLVVEETRAGVLTRLAKILPKKQLPWLLSSEFKTVREQVKKKLNA